MNTVRETRQYHEASVSRLIFLYLYRLNTKLICLLLLDFVSSSHDQIKVSLELLLEHFCLPVVWDRASEKWTSSFPTIKTCFACA